MCRLIVDLMDFQGSTHMMDLFLFSTIVCNSGCYTVFYFSVSLPPFFFFTKKYGLYPCVCLLYTKG